MSSWENRAPNFLVNEKVYTVFQPSHRKLGLKIDIQTWGLFCPLIIDFFVTISSFLSAPILPAHNAVVCIGGPSLQNVEQNLPELRQDCSGKIEGRRVRIHPDDENPCLSCKIGCSYTWLDMVPQTPLEIALSASQTARNQTWLAGKSPN